MESPNIFFYVVIEVGQGGDADACHDLADVLLRGRVNEAFACTEAEVAGVAKVGLNRYAKGMMRVEGFALHIGEVVSSLSDRFANFLTRGKNFIYRIFIVSLHSDEYNS